MSAPKDLLQGAAVVGVGVPAYPVGVDRSRWIDAVDPVQLIGPLDGAGDQVKLEGAEAAHRLGLDEQAALSLEQIVSRPALGHVARRREVASRSDVGREGELDGDANTIVAHQLAPARLMAREQGP